MTSSISQKEAMRHTPGPLEILGHVKTCQIGNFWAIGNEFGTCSGPTAYVASKDDAQLYAAAPDLLASLKAILHWEKEEIAVDAKFRDADTLAITPENAKAFNDEMGIVLLEQARALLQAEAAIAKAENSEEGQ